MHQSKSSARNEMQAQAKRNAIETKFAKSKMQNDLIKALSDFFPRFTRSPAATAAAAASE